MTRDVRIRSLFGAFVLALSALASPWAQAQSFCSSDGQPQPKALQERFISADCESCWADGAARPARGELALDWIVPGSRGDDAPLSAAANRDALSRLAALARPAPLERNLVRKAPGRPACAWWAGWKMGAAV